MTSINGQAPPRGLRIIQKVAFCLGFSQSDLAAAMWFSFLLLFLVHVLGFGNTEAGFLILGGQIADALMTPIAGVISDWAQPKFGRKPVLVAGAVLVAVTFPLIFNSCIVCSAVDSCAPMVRFMWYMGAIVFFQIGWATTQVSHLALIPDLTSTTEERVGLNSMRFSFTVAANIIIFLVAFALLSMGHHDNGSVAPSDLHLFRILSIVVVGPGLFALVIFLFGVKEKRTKMVKGSGCGDVSSPSSPAHLTRKDWLTNPRFLFTMVAYMCARLIVNVTQVYIPFYFSTTLMAPKFTIAAVPLVVYVSSLVSTSLMTPLCAKYGALKIFALGCALSFSAAVGFLLTPASLWWVAFAWSSILGFGGGALLVTALVFVAELASTSPACTAFIYGAMSFSDKFSNGIVLFLIQVFAPSIPDDYTGDGVPYYRYVMFVVPIAAGIIAGSVIGPMRRSKAPTPKSYGKLGVTAPLLGNHSQTTSADCPLDPECCVSSCIDNPTNAECIDVRSGEDIMEGGGLSYRVASSLGRAESYNSTVYNIQHSIPNHQK